MNLVFTFRVLYSKLKFALFLSLLLILGISITNLRFPVAR